MSKFIYKQTNDGIYHVYLDDPSKEGFTKVAQARNFNFVSKSTYEYVFFFNDDGLTKTLLGIIENKVFQVTIPKNSKVLIVKNICIYEKDNIWYTMLLKQNIFEELLLGEKYEVFLSCPANIKYGTLYCYFFTKKAGQYLEIHSIVRGKVVKLGNKYVSMEYNKNGEMFAMLRNGFYDMFIPTSVKPKQGSINEIVETLDRVFIWNNNQNKWGAYEGYVFCKNALYKIQTSEGKDKILLYELKDGILNLVKESYEFILSPFKIIIDNQIYSQDFESDLIDFDNPKPTLKKRVLDFFK